MRTAHPIALSFLILLGACAPGTKEITASKAYEIAVDELEKASATLLQPPNVAGCGDVTAYAYNDADTRAVLVQVLDELAWDAANSGNAISASYTLPHPDVDIEAFWGSNVTYQWCNDVVDPSNPVITNGSAPAISGTIHVTVTPTGGTVQPWEFPGMATIEFEDVTFEHGATGAQKTVGAAILEDVFVGWLPG